MYSNGPAAFYWNALMALTRVWMMPQTSGMPTQPQARASLIPLLVPGDSRALSITRSRTPAPLDLGFRLDGPHMKPLVHRSDEEFQMNPMTKSPAITYIVTL